jgi:hypothetical protein
MYIREANEKAQDLFSSTDVFNLETHKPVDCHMHKHTCTLSIYIQLTEAKDDANSSVNVTSMLAGKQARAALLAHAKTLGIMYVCMYACMHACMYVCSMYVCMCVCMWLSVFVGWLWTDVTD